MTDEQPDYRLVTPGDIVERYGRGERLFFQLKLRDRASFRGQDLSGAVFDECLMFWADFTDAVLRGTSFLNSALKCCEFTRADLTAADLRESAIDGATFTGARLKNVRLNGASAYGCTLSDGDSDKLI